MRVSDFVKQLVIKDMDYVELAPSITTLRLLKSLESILDKKQINQMVDECIIKVQQSTFNDIDEIEYAIEFILLGLNNNFDNLILSFIKNLNLDSKIIDPILINRIAIFARITDNNSLVENIQRFIESKHAKTVSASPFYQLTKSIVAKQTGGARLEFIDVSIRDVLKKQPIDDEFLYLYSICIKNNLLGFPSDRELMSNVMNYIDDALVGRLSLVIATNQHCSTDSGISNLLFAYDTLDSVTRRVCLSWMENFDSNDIDYFENLCNEQPDLLLNISKYLSHSNALLNLIDSDTNLMLSYWTGAALILLEVGVTLRIRTIDEKLYKKLKGKNAKFDEKLAEFEKITTSSVKGLLTRNFYRIRNSVVHGEMDLTAFDLEQICNIVFEYLKRIM